MTLHKNPVDKNAVIDEAAILLFDPNLVWSSDMNDIKDSLGALLVSCKADEGSVLHLLAYSLAQKVLGREHSDQGKIELRG